MTDQGSLKKRRDIAISPYFASTEPSDWNFEGFRCFHWKNDPPPYNMEDKYSVQMNKFVRDLRDIQSRAESPSNEKDAASHLLDAHQANKEWRKRNRTQDCPSIGRKSKQPRQHSDPPILSQTHITKAAGHCAEVVNESSKSTIQKQISIAPLPIPCSSQTKTSKSLNCPAEVSSSDSELPPTVLLSDNDSIPSTKEPSPHTAVAPFQVLLAMSAFTSTYQSNCEGLSDAEHAILSLLHEEKHNSSLCNLIRQGVIDMYYKAASIKCSFITISDFPPAGADFPPASSEFADGFVSQWYNHIIQMFNTYEVHFAFDTYRHMSFWMSISYILTANPRIQTESSTSNNEWVFFDRYHEVPIAFIKYEANPDSNYLPSIYETAQRVFNSAKFTYKGHKDLIPFAIACVGARFSIFKFSFDVPPFTTVFRTHSELSKHTLPFILQTLYRLKLQLDASILSLDAALVGRGAI